MIVRVTFPLKLFHPEDDTPAKHQSDMDGVSSVLPLLHPTRLPN